MKRKEEDYVKLDSLEIASGVVTSDLVGKLDILLKESLSLSVNCAKSSVLKHIDEVSFTSLMHCISSKGRKLEVGVNCFHDLSDLSDEWRLLGESLLLILLVSLDLHDGSGARSVSSVLLALCLDFLGLGCLSLHAFAL